MIKKKKSLLLVKLSLLNQRAPVTVQPVSVNKGKSDQNSLNTHIKNEQNSVWGNCLAAVGHNMTEEIF